MFKRKKKDINSKAPQWFKEWHYEFFKPVDSRSSRNEKMIYLLLAVIFGFNTVGNHYHEEIWGFISRLIGG